jgi:hypothetical protein
MTLLTTLGENNLKLHNREKTNAMRFKTWFVTHISTAILERGKIPLHVCCSAKE